jgi:hypothetical protein
MTPSVKSPLCAAITTMNRSSFELEVLVNGQPIREYGKDGRVFVMGKIGTPYTLRAKNNTANRVLFVVGIDGTNVVDGEGLCPQTASVARGYVVQPFSKCDIDGWRVSDKEVAQFVFSDKTTAYSCKTGSPTEDCGIIAAKVFAEKVPVAPPPFYIREEHHHYHPPLPSVQPNPWYVGPNTTPIWYSDPYCTTSLKVGGDTSDATSMSMSMDMGAVNTFYSSVDNASGELKRSCEHSPAPDFNLGTAWGNYLQSGIVTVAFERGNEIASFDLYYSDRAGLEHAGIELDRKPAVSAWPKSFNSGYCKPPQ